MAGNEWINSYLEAILDAGSSTKKRDDHVKLTKDAKFQHDNKQHQQQQQQLLKEEKPFSTTRYFVEEVITSFDESDLYRTWVKVIATRNSRERNNRLENMCWRIWHLARKKKQIAWDDARRLAKRRLEREQGRNDAADDLSELSEGEKEKGDPNVSEPIKNLSRINSDSQIWFDDTDKSKHLYIVLISMHGLVRGENMELGRDSDTGGQVKYVVELARALANTKGVDRVDLLTRQITSPEVDSSYGEPIEMLSCPSHATGSCGAYIIRIPCGPRDNYIAKESLWPHIPEFVDGALNHIVNMARALGDQLNGGKPTWPYVIHGHYADAGEVAAHLSGALNVPMVLTGHSLGRNKFEQLLKQGRLSKEAINATYKIMRRTEGEELGLDAAEMVVTSTMQEIEEQWGLYDGFDLKLERKLRVRRRRGVSCLGRYMPRMVVIPPGMDFSYVTTQDSLENDGDLMSLLGSDDRAQNKTHLPQIWSEIMRFFTNPHKPTILALSRPDPKKNVTTLLKAFGECQPLRELANLTLILGNRDDIEDMSSSSSVVLTTVLKLIDRYDLYGQVAYPKHHKQSEVPEIYRLAAKTKGVFINPALVEPFGLTLIEAAAYGLPVVATKNGGPVDILKVLNNGLLVDPHDQNAIADALLKLVADKNLWAECRKNGLRNIHRFSWTEHCRNYLSRVEHCRNRHPTSRLEIMTIPEEPMSDSLRDVEDISLRFSIDGDIKLNGEIDATARQKKIVEAFTRMASLNSNTGIVYSPGRRQMLFVIAADCYDSNGETTETFQAMIMNVMKDAGLCFGLGKIGFVLLTGSSFRETMQALSCCPVNIEDFDALVCNSGSEMYYPWKDMVADTDYEAHIAYRWPGENVRSMAMRLARTEDGAEDDITEYVAACSSRCYSYSIKPGAKTRRIDDLRQRLRMRGFRCNLVYTRAASRLNVVPLFASRIQALRYLSIRWAIDLSKVVLFVGEKGDTDYEDLLGGLHKTIVLKGTVAYGSGKLLRNEDNFKREDAVAQGNPNIKFVETSEGQNIAGALVALGIK
ncbi:putative sucrose-phosphate synthase 4 isoform X2 [Gossypium australe]|uniref:Sucrose-phosphate synthase n=1 Tax=Gossypium australe TaxID=47621 RepID=A0A5B6UAA5_9ROSI|nr:putative sucrose-phosphate synthase 4 isoform X2 [Gossypium australe]